MALDCILLAVFYELRGIGSKLLTVNRDLYLSHPGILPITISKVVSHLAFKFCLLLISVDKVLWVILIEALFLLITDPLLIFLLLIFPFSSVLWFVS